METTGGGGEGEDGEAGVHVCWEGGREGEGHLTELRGCFLRVRELGRVRGEGGGGGISRRGVFHCSHVCCRTSPVHRKMEDGGESSTTRKEWVRRQPRRESSTTLKKDRTAAPKRERGSLKWWSPPSPFLGGAGPPRLL